MPQLTMRVSDEDHASLKQVALERGVSVANLVREALRAVGCRMVGPGDRRIDVVPEPPVDAREVVKAALMERALVDEGLERPPVSKVRTPQAGHRHSSSSFTSTGLPVCVCGLRHVAGQWVAVNEEER